MPPRPSARYALFFALAGSIAGAVIAACSGGDSGGGGPSGPVVCDVKQCGTRLPASKGKCPDGTTSGATGRCIETGDETSNGCAWEVHECDGTCAAQPTSCLDGTTKTGTCSTDPSGACACTNPCDCTLDDCGGPDPYSAPAEVCADGHIGGSYCTRASNGQCGWVLKAPCPKDAGPDANDGSTDGKPDTTPIDTGHDAGVDTALSCSFDAGTCAPGCFAVDAWTVDTVHKCWTTTKRLGCAYPAETGDAAVVYNCAVDPGGTVYAIPNDVYTSYTGFRACTAAEKATFDAASFTSCTPADGAFDAPPPPADTAPDAPYGDASACDFDTVIQPIFSTNCAVAGCHTGSTPTGNQNLSAGFAYSNIVEVTSIEVPPEKRVARFHPESSYLYAKITGSPAPGTNPMPPPSTGSTLSPAQKAAILCWISAGAPP